MTEKIIKASRTTNIGKAYSVPAIHRTLDIIETLVENRTLTVSEVNRRFRIPKSSAYAILQTLMSRGYVEKDSLDRYSLSLRLFTLGGALVESLDLRKEVSPLLKELTEKAHITGHIAIRDGGQAVYIDKIEVMGALRLTTWVGKHMHLHSTSMGKTLLSWLPEEDVEQIVAEQGLPRLTPKTITKLATLKKELGKIRTQGYAVGNEENEIGVRGVSAPIFNSEEKVVGAVNLGASKLHMRGEDLPRLGALVREYGLRMSKQLGYSAPLIRA